MAHRRTSIFISHASEDKESVARDLARELTALGYSVWFDEYSLRVGDSLRTEIDRGLAKCKYGVVVLSPTFFAKSWTRRELDGLVARETESRNRRNLILPVWHNVSLAQVRKYSPILADRVAINTSIGIPAVATRLAEAIATRRANTRLSALGTANSSAAAPRRKGEPSDDGTVFLLYKLVNPDSICGYAIVGADAARRLWIEFSENHISLQQEVGWEENQWLNTDYAVTDQRVAVALPKLTAAIELALRESDYTVIVSSNDTTGQPDWAFTFRRTHEYYELEYKFTPSVGWCRTHRPVGTTTAASVAELAMLETAHRVFAPLWEISSMLRHESAEAVRVNNGPTAG